MRPYPHLDFLASSDPPHDLAIPALGAGTGGLPIDRCAQLTHHALSHTLTQRPHPSLREITLVLWRPADLIAFDQAFTHGLEREASDT
jgi:O-acetyl-ADP-ribose deacetylase (regulator of RNase III)